jgi:signal transduction histidine kinase/ligand-binding sensor protein/ActR/RegA family two-component response regulator
MPSGLTGLLDIQGIQQLLDSFYELTGISAAIVDASGEIIFSSVRPLLCSQFYDNRDRAINSCRLSRALLQNKEIVSDQHETRLCPHGLLDAIEPIIIQGERLGALLIGQVFAEKPDIEFYREESEKYDFNKELFLLALESVPIVEKCRFEQAVHHMISLTRLLAEQGMARLQAEQNALTCHEHAENAVKENRRKRAQLKLYANDQASCNDLLDAALEDSLELTDSSIGYIYTYDEDTRLFTLYAWSQSVMPECAIVHKQTVYELDKTGLWGEAVRQRKPIITNDYSAPTIHKKGYPKGHVHLVRHMNLPIFRNNRIVAVVGVGNKAVDYSNYDVHQLELYLGSVWNMVERRKAEEELKKAKELAEISSQMKTDLMANFSHELRTPLNGIIGGSQLLAFTELTQEQQDYLQMIEESSANELELVNNLLDLVKLELDGIAVERTTFSVRRCCDDLAQAHEAAAHSKGLQIYQNISQELPVELVGDKVRMRQIMHSLIGNAIKFTDQGSITIRVSLNCQSDEQLLVCFSVIDTGIGIDPEKLDTIFELFTQVDMSNTRKFGGLGLGLPICKRLVSALGGKIWAENGPGQGSSFHVELPLEPVQHISTGAVKKKNLIILLAEDDPMSQATVKALLRKMGHTVVVAENGNNAVKEWERNSCDLILMDIHMPDMDGFEALQTIRRLEREQNRPKTPVIAQTAYARWNYHESFLNADFDGFIAKPLMLNDLEAAIASCCL